MLALGLALKYLGKAYTLALPDRAPESLSFLPGSSALLVAPDSLPPSDLIIVPDCSDLTRLGDLYEQHVTSFADSPIVNIDHHVSNSLFGMLNFVDQRAAAVCEQLFFLLPQIDVPIDLPIATCLLTGVVTDSQTFRTPSTTARTMRVATALFEAGAPMREIADQVYNSKPLATLKLWGLALSQLSAARGVIWTRLTEAMLQESGASWEESEALVSLLASVRTADAALLFKQMPDSAIRVSLRSAGKVNVAAVAAHFGGGGHFGAAGCTLNVPLAEAEQLVVARVQDTLGSVKATN
ncbi:MAG: DHHA1 domain-containing protein [Chloroflexi bacterium]|nr:DHHA1 domain-containing protein [Chloroflexota bacterium]